uniref:MSP domain-containing protein n=1 Tax=Rhabditophanes sp. KR3021 TaxID=114890 RepID=A0AC35TKL7_9BILA
MLPVGARYKLQRILILPAPQQTVPLIYSKNSKVLLRLQINSVSIRKNTFSIYVIYLCIYICTSKHLLYLDLLFGILVRVLFLDYGKVSFWSVCYPL